MARSKSRMPSSVADVPVGHPLVVAVGVGVVALGAQHHVVGLAGAVGRVVARHVGEAQQQRAHLVASRSASAASAFSRSPSSRLSAIWASASSALPWPRRRPTSFESALTWLRTSSRSAASGAARRRRRAAASTAADVPGPRRSSSALTASGSVRIRRRSSMAGEATGAGRTAPHGFARAPPGLDHGPPPRFRRRRRPAVSVAAAMAAVDVESLTITYGEVVAVDDLSFPAEAGEVTCVLGPNGAGKTSTIEALEGLRRPDRGPAVGPRPRPAGRPRGADRPHRRDAAGGRHPPRGAGARGAAPRRRALPDAARPGRAVDRLGLAGLERAAVPAAVGRRAAAGGPGAGAGRAGRRWRSSTSRPPGVDPAGRQVIRQVVAEPARRRRHRAADHPRPRRGRARRRPRRDHRSAAGWSPTARSTSCPRRPGGDERAVPRPRRARPASLGRAPRRRRR